MVHNKLLNIYQVYHVLQVCRNVNRHHHVVETIHALSHSFAEDIILRCRWELTAPAYILVTAVNLCVLEISEIDPIQYLYIVLY